MKTLFADSGYWIALINRHDSLHEKAQSLSASLDITSCVTSEMVLTEVLNYVSSCGAKMRQSAVEMLDGMRKHPQITVVPQTTDQFQNAVRLYAQRNDKDWSLTDCSSFQVMWSHQITEALTHDHNFEQAGFKALLRV